MWLVTIWTTWRIIFEMDRLLTLWTAFLCLWFGMTIGKLCLLYFCSCHCIWVCGWEEDKSRKMQIFTIEKKRSVLKNNGVSQQKRNYNEIEITEKKIVGSRKENIPEENFIHFFFFFCNFLCYICCSSCLSGLSQFIFLLRSQKIFCEAYKTCSKQW